MKYRIFFACFFFILAGIFWSWPWGDTIPVKYTTGTLTAGVGLEGLKIGITRIEEFIQKLGIGQAGTLITDEYTGFQFVFDGGNISFLFILDENCKKSIGSLKNFISIRKDPEVFFSQYPLCKDTTLSAISVTGGFDGKTEKGIVLGDTIEHIFEYGDVYTSRSDDIIMGLAPEETTEVGFLSGIYFYYIAIGAKQTSTDTKIQRITITEGQK